MTRQSWESPWSWTRWRNSVNDQLQTLQTNVQQVRKRTVTLQEDVDALTAEVQTVATDLESDFVKIQAAYDALEAQITGGTPVTDLTALAEAIAPLDARVQALGNLTPTPPAPPAV